MLGKQSGQMGFGDMEAKGRVPEGHFLQKIDRQVNWRPFEQLLEPLYHPTRGRPSHPPEINGGSRIRLSRWISRLIFALWGDERKAAGGQCFRLQNSHLS